MSDSRTDIPAEEYRDRRLWEWEKLEGGGAVITGYNGDRSDISVPARIDGHTIEVIGRLAKPHDRNTRIRRVTLPDTVVEIAESAFEGLDVLERVNLSWSLRYIGNSAFRECSRLKSVDFPDTLEVIEDAAFLDCTSLKSAFLPDSLRILGDDAFSRCTNLEEVRIPDNLEYMGRAFCDCKGLEDEDGFVAVGGVLYNYYGYSPDVVIPEGVMAIDNFVFSGNKRLINVVLPDTLLHIGSHAFDGAANLHTAALPDGLQKIDNDAFRNCTNLESINIPRTIQRLQDCAFKGCLGLADRDGFVIVGGVLFDYVGYGGDVFVPDGVIRISDEVFSDRSDITSVKLPVSARGMDHFTFRDCRGLADENGYIIVGGVLYDYVGLENFLTIPEGVREIKNHSIPRDRVASVKLPSTLQRVDGFTFNGCQRLSDNNGFIIIDDVVYGYVGYACDVVVPYGVTAINDDAFNSCKDMRSVKLPETVKRIGNGAFYGCDKLECINLRNVRHIGQDAFCGCERLKGVELEPDADIDDTAFADCYSLADENGFVIMNGILFDYLNREPLEVITVPGSVQVIGEKLAAFGRGRGFSYGAMRRYDHPLWQCRVIRGKKGSCVEEYAYEKGIEFEGF